MPHPDVRPEISSPDAIPAAVSSPSRGDQLGDKDQRRGEAPAVATGRRQLAHRRPSMLAVVAVVMPIMVVTLALVALQGTDSQDAANGSKLSSGGLSATHQSATANTDGTHHRDHAIRRTSPHS